MGYSLKRKWNIVFDYQLFTASNVKFLLGLKT